MTPAARLALAIDLFDAILSAVRHQGPAADTLIAHAFKQRRYAGAKDRAAVRGLIYDWLRNLEWLKWQAGTNAAARALVIADQNHLALFGQGAYAPPAIQAHEEPTPRLDPPPPWVSANTPEWLWQRLMSAFPDDGADLLAALNQRAPLDVLVRGDAAIALRAFDDATPLPWSPIGLRLPAGHALPNDDMFEAQDEGSQLVALAVEPNPGEVILDLCAGAGGKTLALARLAPDAQLHATDIDPRRLHRARDRLARWGYGAVSFDLPPLETCDAVLIDAPCSGQGTWRRNPEARFRLTPDSLARYCEIQRALIAKGATFLKPGGRLIYAVCSLLPDEGPVHLTHAQTCGLAPLPARISAPHHKLAPNCVALTPHRTGTDGFTVAWFQRIS
jgi:16S rRNA (cytosine967-C5)-methyltransferase